MKRPLPRPGGLLLGLVFLALVAAGCGGAAGAVAPRQATPSPDQLTLTVLHTTVGRTQGSGISTDLRADDSVALQAQDRVTVGDKGRALVRLGDQVAVEVMGDSQLEVQSVRVDPGTPPHVGLKQLTGNSNVQLTDTNSAGVTLTTEYASVTAGGGNSQVLVCHVPGVLTCVIAVNGGAVVQAQNQAVTVHSGESTYVFPGQAPRAPICAHMREVRLWLQQVRSTGDAGDLGSLVINWPQQPCTQAGAEGTATGEGIATGGGVPLGRGSGTGGGIGGGRGAGTQTVQGTPAPSAGVPSTSTPVPTGTAAPTLRPTEAPTLIPTGAPSAPPTAAPTESPTPPPASTTGPTAPPAAPLPPGKDMVQIQAGKYVIGTSDTDENHVKTQELTLPEFWIDRYEVTNALYRSFLEKTGRAAPPSWADGTFPSGHEAHPAAGLTWEDAAAYCAWAGKRLPTEAEWEVAGRGPGADPPLYPWGADPAAGGQADALPPSDTYPAGAFPFNKSLFGVYDMTGSVWQWVGEPYAPVPYGYQVLRGGRHGLLQDMAYRQPAKPDDQRFARVAGVRCAADRVAGGYP